MPHLKNQHKKDRKGNSPYFRESPTHLGVLCLSCVSVPKECSPPLSKGGDVLTDDAFWEFVILFLECVLPLYSKSLPVLTLLSLGIFFLPQ